MEKRLKKAIKKQEKMIETLGQKMDKAEEEDNWWLYELLMSLREKRIGWLQELKIGI